MAGALFQICVRRCANQRGYFLINLIGAIFTLSTISLLIDIGSKTCPDVVEADKCPYYVGFGVFVVFECLLNFACFHYFAYRNRIEYILPTVNGVRSDQKVGEMENNPDEIGTSKFCGKCERSVPVRSHHCPVCQYCVLKNDHHCFALAKCVGFGNQRYFVVFAFWAAIGGFYGSWMIARYFNKSVIPIWPFGIFDYFFPFAFVKWLLFQHIEFTKLGYPFLMSTGFAGGSGALLFFVFQWILIMKGLTMMEMYKAKKIKQYSSFYDPNVPGWIRIEHVFGRFWFLNFIFPTPFRNRMDDSLSRFVYEFQMKGV